MRGIRFAGDMAHMCDPLMVLRQLRLADCRPINLSPDGKWVVCHDELADDWTVLLVPTGPGQPRRMRRRGEEGAGFGMDGCRTASTDSRPGGKQAAVFRRTSSPVDGGPAQPIAPEGSICTWASPDGKSALCAPDADGLSRIYSLERQRISGWLAGLRANRRA